MPEPPEFDSDSRSPIIVPIVLRMEAEEHKVSEQSNRLARLLGQDDAGVAAMLAGVVDDGGMG